MSEFLDNLAGKAGQWLRAAKDTAVDIGEKGKALAESAIEKGRDKAQEMKLNSQLRDTFAKLGESFYEQAVNGTDFADKDELLEKITAIKQTLSDLAEKAERANEAVEEEVEEAVCDAADAVEEACEEAADAVEEACDTTE